MNRMRLTAALLAAGGALGAGAGAQATTVDFDISGVSAPQDVVLIAGGPASFTYGYDDAKSKSFFTPEAGSLVGQLTPSYVDPHTDTTYGSSQVKTGKVKEQSPSASLFAAQDSSLPGYKPVYEDAYANLKFTVDGTSYIGTAHFAGDDATLESVTFDPSGAPAPQAWALLIAGVGVAGASMRRRAQVGATA